MSIAFAFALAAIQAASGAVWWALAIAGRRSKISAFELVGIGLALGSFVAMATGIVLVSTPLAGVATLLPSAVTIVLAVAFRERLSALRITLPLAQILAVVIGLAVGIAIAVGNWHRIPLDNPTAKSFADLYFFEALGRGLSHWGPVPSILMTDGSLRYHWFTYAWAGQIERLAGTAPFFVVTRLLPLVVLAGVVTIAAAWAGRLSRVRWVPSLAVLLIVAGGYAGALYGSILNYDSPSQSMATMWLLALAVTALTFTRGRASKWSLVLVGALAMACTGGKISHAVVGAAGLAVMTLAGIISRQEWWRRAVAVAAVAAVAMVTTYVVVLAGVAVDRNLSGEVALKASTWQGLDPVIGPMGVALGTLALTLAVLARVAGLGWLFTSRRWRMDPAVLFASGGLLAGLVAMLVLSQGVNELWFVLAASAPAAVLSAHGVGLALARLKRSSKLSHPLVLAVAVAVPASAVALILTRNWPSHQNLLNWLAPLSIWLLVPLGAMVATFVGVRPGNRILAVVALSMSALALTSILTRPSTLWTSSRTVTTIGGTITPTGGPAPIGTTSRLPQTAQEYGGSTSYPDAAAAAQWIDANVPADAILASGWPATAIVPALTGRQMYIDGNVYQAGLGAAGEVSEVWIRTYASLAFSADPSTVTVAPLCAAGVGWVWLDHPQTGVPGVVDVVYANATTTILRVLPDACTD